MEAKSTDSRYTNCKMCGSRRLTLADAVHHLVQCGECGFVFGVEIYSSAELAHLYTTLYSAGEGYDQYYSSAFQKLKRGETPWVGFESRTVIRHILGKGAKVIGEIGASLGMTAQYLKHYSVEYYGFEFDEKTAQSARELGFNIVCGDHSRLKGLPRRLDALVAFEVLEHVADIKPCLDNIRACLKPSGLLGLTVPNYNRRLNDPRPGALSQQEPPIHLNFWTLPSLKNTLKICGFEPELLRVRRRPNINMRKPVATLTAYCKALFNKYHGPQIICVARKTDEPCNPDGARLSSQ